MLVETWKRSLETQNLIETKWLSLSKSTPLSVTATLGSNESDSDNAKRSIGWRQCYNHRFLYWQKNVIEAQKIDGIPKQAYLIADKHGMSSRCLTEMAAGFHSSQGTPLNQLNLSVNTSRRRKENTRLTIATHILKNQLNESIATLYALYWDRKLIKSLMHTGNDIERVAIYLQVSLCNVIFWFLKQAICKK